MSPEQVDKYILKHKGAELSFPFGQELAVYTINGEMFVTSEVGKLPPRISLRCEKLLADTLKNRYEEVMPPYKLNQDKWIRVVLSGQLSPSEIEGLIDYSYKLAKADSLSGRT